MLDNFYFCALLLLLFVIPIQAMDIELTILVPANQRECFYQPLEAGKTVEVEYEVVAGGDVDINYLFYSPTNRVLQSDFKKRDGHQILKLEETGEYQFCFDNSVSVFHQKQVYFSLRVINKEGHNENDRVTESWMNDVARDDLGELQDKIEEFKDRFQRIWDNMEGAQRYQKAFNNFEVFDRVIAENNFERVNFWSVIHIVLMITVTVIQVVTIRSLFETKSTYGNSGCCERLSSNLTMSSKNSHSNEPRPRLCHLRRWPDFVGYGFNLHCEKAKPGQFIGKVDPDSPAEAAGLRENDRIIEVNSTPIGFDNHRQVVTRIKEVLDPIANDYYKNSLTTIQSTDSNVEKHETPIRGGKEDKDDTSSRSSYGSVGAEERQIPRQLPEPSPDYNRAANRPIPAVSQIKSTNSPAISRTSDRADTPPNDDDPHLPASPPASNKSDRKGWSTYKPNPPANSSPAPSPKDFRTKPVVTNSSPAPSPRDFHTKPVVTNSSHTSSTNGSAGVFELKMSAAEYREKLKAQSARKRDPREDRQMSMKEKHDLIERL